MFKILLFFLSNLSFNFVVDIQEKLKETKKEK